MKGVLKVILGVGLPFLLLLAVMSSLGNYRFSEPPPPASLDEDQPSGDASVELVGTPDGEWVLADGSESYVGYRVVEHYPRRISTGVGRTTAVEAALTLEDSTITEVQVRADLRGLESDRQNRDRAVQVRYLEAREHPWAVFTLREAVPVHRVQPGIPFTIRIPGELTIRGITHPVTAELEGRWDGDVVQVVGRLPVHLPDFEIRAPDIAGFVTVEEDAHVEVDLTFERNTRSAAAR